MIFRSLLIILLVFLLGCMVTKNYKEIDKSQIHEIHSIDPENENFSDLQFLKKVLNNKRIVWLGEDSHYSGSTEYAKTRIIKFLHSEMGFEILLIEGGIYPIKQIADLLGNHQVKNIINKGPEHPFYLMKSSLPLWNYIKNSQKSNSPLKLNGIDIWGIDKAIVDNSAPQLSSVYENDTINRLWTKYRRVVCQYFKDDNFVNKPESTKQVVDVTKNLLEHCNYHLNKHKDDSLLLFWTQVIKSNLGYFRWVNSKKRIHPTKLKSIEKRDYYMADNISFFLNEYYKDQKVIISTSNFHALRNYGSIRKVSRSIKEFKTAGSYIFNDYGKKIYTIAFVSLKGREGVGDDYSIVNSPSNSFQGYLGNFGYDYAFVKLEDVGKIKINPASKFITAEWGKIYDGLFFIKEIEPQYIDTTIPLRRVRFDCDF